MPARNQRSSPSSYALIKLDTRCIILQRAVRISPDGLCHQMRNTLEICRIRCLTCSGHPLNNPAQLLLKFPLPKNLIHGSHIMHHLLPIIRGVRRFQKSRTAVCLLVVLLPLPLGWPLAIWLAGGRGSAAASSLLMTVCRSISCAFNSPWRCSPTR